MTRLSVNINKIATLRNARGGNVPDVLKAAVDCLRFGADGITVHPRPDERHIRYSDVVEIRKVVGRQTTDVQSSSMHQSSVISHPTEFNIEGFPEKKWMDLVLKVKPEQATLVPDAPDALTSNAGWDTIKHQSFLKEIISELKRNKIRTSIFIGTDIKMIENAAKCGTDRVELYTEPFAKNFYQHKTKAIKPFVEAAKRANEVGLGLNAGHDLNLENLKFFAENIPNLLEVSIGHALISDALYFGLENTIQLYLRQLR